jgi:hypothetical protein
VLPRQYYEEQLLIIDVQGLSVLQVRLCSSSPGSNFHITSSADSIIREREGQLALSFITRHQNWWITYLLPYDLSMVD